MRAKMAGAAIDDFIVEALAEPKQTSNIAKVASAPKR